MGTQILVEQLKLDLTVLPNNQSKEVIFQSTGNSSTPERNVVIWTRKYELSDNVYVDRSPNGQLRVVKRLAHRDSTSTYPAELNVMGQVTSATKGEGGDLFVKFIGWFEFDHYTHFVMEYCPLGDLSCYYPNPLSETETRSICGQLLKGLAILHSLGITHQGIKPQNILVVQESPTRVKIADFGFSKQTSKGTTEKETDLQTQIGPECYIAPEVLGLLDDTRESSSFTSAVDIWSLGCLLYYVLTKQTPFDTYRSLRSYSLGEAPFPERALLDHGVSLDGKAFIWKLLRPSPEARPKASETLLREWNVYLDGVAPTKKDVTCQPPSFEPTSNNTTTNDLMQRDPFSTSAMGPSEAPPPYQDEPPLSPTPRVNMTSISLQVWEIFHDKEGGDFSATEKVQLLLEAGADPNFIWHGYTSLHLAILNLKPCLLKLLLDYGVDVNICTANGLNPLSLAFGNIPHGDTKLRGRFEIVLLILDRAFDLEVLNAPSIEPPLHALIRSSHESRTKSVIADSGEWAYWVDKTAWIERRTELAQKAVAIGANIECRNTKGQTPLSYAICLQELEMAKAMVSLGAKVNTQDENGRTPLHHAISGNPSDVQIIRWLLHTGADVNQEDFEGRAPLFEAASLDLGRSIIGLLLDVGANHDFKDEIVMKRIRRVQNRQRLGERLLSPFK